MGRCRFVPPEIVRLSLSDGDWLDVKRELNAGEARHIQIRQMATPVLTPGERIQLDPARVMLAEALEYLVAWSLVDTTGQVAAISESALQALDQESQREILEAIRAHAAAAEAALEAVRINRSSATGLRAAS